VGEKTRGILRLRLRKLHPNPLYQSLIEWDSLPHAFRLNIGNPTAPNPLQYLLLPELAINALRTTEQTP
jgi:hypothetical protein